MNVDTVGWWTFFEFSYSFHVVKNKLKFFYWFLCVYLDFYVPHTPKQNQSIAIRQEKCPIHVLKVTTAVFLSNYSLYEGDVLCATSNHQIKMYFIPFQIQFIYMNTCLNRNVFIYLWEIEINNSPIAHTLYTEKIHFHDTHPSDITCQTKLHFVVSDTCTCIRTQHVKDKYIQEKKSTWKSMK